MDNRYKIPINPRLLNNDTKENLIDNVKFFNIIFSIIEKSEFVYLFIPDPDEIEIDDRYYGDISKLMDIAYLIRDYDLNFTDLDSSYRETWYNIEIDPESKIYGNDNLYISKNIIEKPLYSQLYSMLMTKSAKLVKNIDINISSIGDYEIVPKITSDDVLLRIKELYDIGVDRYGSRDNSASGKSLEMTLENNPIDNYVRGFDHWIENILKREISVRDIVFNEDVNYVHFFKIENITPMPMSFNVKVNGENVKLDNYHEYYRMFKKDYSIMLIADIISYKRDLVTGEVTSTGNWLNVKLGKIPLMVGSKYSPIGEYLNKIPESKWDEALELIDNTKYTRGGYFLSEGAERSYVNQKRLGIDKVFIYKIKDRLVSTMTSYTDFGSATSNFFISDNSITFSFRTMLLAEENLLLLVKYYSQNMIYRHMDKTEEFFNYPSDVKESKKDMANPVSFEKVAKFLFDNIESHCANIIFDNESDPGKVRMLMKRVKFFLRSTRYKYDSFDVKNANIDETSKPYKDIFDNWLPQISMNRFDPKYYKNGKYNIINETLSKFYLTSIMVGNLILAKLDVIPLTDKNSYTNIKIQSPTELVQIHTRRVINDAIDSFLNNIDNISSSVIKSEHSVQVNRFKSLSEEIYKNITKQTFDPLATMKWNNNRKFVTGKTEDNFIQAPDPDTNLAFWTSMQRVTTPVSKQTTNIATRSRHPHDEGYEDPNRTPESHTCGLTGYFATGARLAVQRDDNIIYDLFKIDYIKSGTSTKHRNLDFSADPKCYRLRIKGEKKYRFVNVSTFLRFIKRFYRGEINMSKFAPRSYELEFEEDQEFEEEYSSSGKFLSFVINGKFVGWTNTKIYAKLDKLKHKIDTHNLQYYTMFHNIIVTTQSEDLSDSITQEMERINNTSDDYNNEKYKLFINNRNVGETSSEIYDILSSYLGNNSFDIAYYTKEGTIYVNTDNKRLVKPIINMKYMELYKNGGLDGIDIETLVRDGIARFVSPSEVWDNTIFQIDEDGNEKWYNNMDIPIYEDIEEHEEIKIQISNSIARLEEIRSRFIEELESLQFGTEIRSVDSMLDLIRENVDVSNLQNIEFEEKVYNLLDISIIDEMIESRLLYQKRKSSTGTYRQYFAIRDLTVGYTSKNIPLRQSVASNRNMYQTSMDNQKSEVQNSASSSNSGNTKKMIYGTYDPFRDDKIANSSAVLIYVGSIHGKNQEDMKVVNENVEQGKYFGLMFKTSKIVMTTDSDTYTKVIERIPIETTYPIDHLDERGIVRPGTYLTPGMPVYTYSKTYIKEYKDRRPEYLQKMVSQDEYGYVDKVITSTIKSGQIIILKIIQYIKVIDGDKFHDLNGAQKGTVYLVPYYQLPYTKNGTIPTIGFEGVGYPSRTTPGHAEVGILCNAITQTNEYKYDRKRDFPYNLGNAVKSLTRYGFDVSGKHKFIHHGIPIKNEICMMVMFTNKLRHLSEDKFKNPGKNMKINQDTQQSKDAPKSGYMAQRVLETLGMTNIIDSMKNASDIISIPYCKTCNLEAMYSEYRGDFECTMCESPKDVIKFDTRVSFIKFRNMLMSAGISIKLSE